jgi:hypothetical protein
METVETIAEKDIVRLKGTRHLYRVRQIYEVHKDTEILPDEKWCRLVKKGGKEAFWSLKQLELVSKFKETDGLDRN